MSLVFMHGFDDGIATGANGYYTVVETNATYNDSDISLVSGGRTGNRLRLANGGGDHGYIKRVLYPADAHATLIVGIYVAPPTFYSSYPLLLGVFGDAGATEHVRLKLTAGTLEALRGGASGTQLFSVASFCETGASAVTPFYLELKVTLADSGGTVTVHKNGALFTGATFTGDTKNGGTNATLDAFAIGSHSNGPNNTHYEDLYVCNGAGSTNNDLLGDVSVYTVFPNGNGNSSQWTGSDGNSTDNYLLVDENPPSMTDYVTSSTLNHVDTYAHGAHGVSSGTVKGVMVTAFGQRSGATDGAIEPVARSSSAQSYGPERVVGATATPQTAVFETDPNTSAVWGLAAVDAAEFGVRNADPA